MPAWARLMGAQARFHRRKPPLMPPAKVNPERAAIYLKNEAVIFYQENNADAQAAAADEAIKADPTLAIAYYLKGNGLIHKVTVDKKTNKPIPPPGCLEAYRKYLDLAPNGQYAAE